MKDWFEEYKRISAEIDHDFELYTEGFKTNDLDKMNKALKGLKLAQIQKKEIRMSDKRIEIQEAFEKVINKYKEFLQIEDVETSANEVVNLLCEGKKNG